MKNATSTDYLRIFPSYANISRTIATCANPSDPDQRFSTAIAETSVNDALSGDCLVLVDRDADDDRKIARLIACFRAPTTASDPAGNGPVRRLVLDLTPTSILPVSRSMPTITTPAIPPEVVEFCRGLALGQLV